MNAPYTIACLCNSMCPTKEQATNAFNQVGMVLVDFQRECMFLGWALTECGNLYLYDGSHGGGQHFSLESKRK